MKLELVERPDQHKELVSAVCWSVSNELLACSDDKTISKWTADGEFSGLVVNELPAYVTDVSYLPSTGKQASELFAVSCSDGTYRLLTRQGREEKKVDAHSGAVTRIRWNQDGTALLSAGEEGDVKVWSRNGNLRSTLAQAGKPVYALAWGPDNDQVVAGSDKDLILKAVVQAGKKAVQWRAHDGVVMCVDWNMVNGLIVSGGEDCTYKVWDAFGRQLYQSAPLEHVVTSVAWRPNGDQFAVGAFNMVRLCDRTGWAYCRERPACGSLLQLCWSGDGTQLAGAGGNGTVLLGQLVHRALWSESVEALQLEARKVRVQDVVHDSYEDLQLRDRVLDMALGYGFLVIATATQAYAYSVKNWNTPHIHDLRQGAAVNLVLLSPRQFLLLDSATGLTVYSYEGRQLSQPRFQGLRPDCLSRASISLAPDCVAVIDHTDSKSIRVLDVMTGKQISSNITHNTEIVEIALSVHGQGTQERRVAFIDKNRDLWLSPVAPLPGYSSLSAAKIKLQTQVETLHWNDKCDSLAACADGRLHVWAYPNVVFVDKELLPLTRLVQDGSELGKMPHILSFSGPRLEVRRLDGAAVSVGVPPYPMLLYELVGAAKREQAVRLCRFIKHDQLWACLAAMAIAASVGKGAAASLETAEVAYAALGCVDKLDFILHVSNIPSEEGRSAELALYRRCPEEAERILLQAVPPLLYRAIKLNVRLFRWARALELAVTHRSHVDTVLGYRQHYLQGLGRSESDPRFLQYAQQVTVDWDAINAKKAKDRADETNRAANNRGAAGRK